jgi:sporulation protein YlmC with PRC-barrel domain
VHLVRDLLDKAVVDRNGRDMGRVDRIVLEVEKGAPARVVAVEVGASSLGERLSASFGRWVAGFLHALDVDQGQPVRIHVSQILDVTDTVKVDLSFGETPVANVERKLRGFISGFPGAHR